MTTISPGSVSGLKGSGSDSGTGTSSSSNTQLGIKRQRVTGTEGAGYHSRSQNPQFHGQMMVGPGLVQGVDGDMSPLDHSRSHSERKNSLTSLDLDATDLDISKLASTLHFGEENSLFGPSSSSSPNSPRNQANIRSSVPVVPGISGRRNNNNTNRRSIYRPNNETLTTTNHLLILSESLEEMARKGEWCDLELSVAKVKSSKSSSSSSGTSTKRAVVKLHSIVAVASSQRLKQLLTDIKKGVIKQKPAAEHSKNKKVKKEPNSTDTKVKQEANTIAAIYDPVLLPPYPDKPGIVRLEFHDTCVDVESMNALRTYMYMGILAVSMDTVLGLLDASNYLDIKGSKKLCVDHLKGHVDIKNVLKVLTAAHNYSINRLKQTALEFIDQEFENVVLEPYWLELDVEILKMLISRDTLCVRAEASIFIAVSNWAQAGMTTDSGKSVSGSEAGDSQSERIKVFENMISEPGLIRLSNMSREELIQVSQTQVVSNSGELRRALYDEAMSRVNQTEGQSKPKRLRNYTANHLSNPEFAGNSMRRYPIYDLKKCEATLHGHSRAVCAITVCGNDVLSGSGDGTIRVWSSTNNWECYKVLKGHSNSIVALKVYQDKLLSASPDKTICVWEVGTWKHDRVLTGHRSAVCALSICYNDKLCSGSDDGQLKVWNCRTWALERTIQAHSHVIWSLASCREFIISGSSDTTIRVWDSNNWRFIVTLDQHRDEVQALAVSEDTTELYSGSDDGMICVWNTYTWECVRTLDSNKRAILSLCVYGPNKIVSGLGNGVVKVWNSNPLTSDGALTEHTSCVMAVAVFNGKVVSASYDKTVKVWGP